MNSLFDNHSTQVEVLNFQTFTTEYVAKRYGTSLSNIKDHKRLHADEIFENIHFITEINKFKKPITKWTLRGIIKLGMFIRSPEAKNFRLWAEAELEKSILKELERAKEARKANLELVDKIANLEAIQISQSKHTTSVINGYKSQIVQHNKQISQLKETLNRYDKSTTTFLRDEPRVKKVDFDGLNQVLQRAVYLTLENAKKELYKNTTNITLMFERH